MTLRYLHLDVFTSERFAGNQLAVFPEPGEISTELMQAIAKEMAFSESTFLFPAQDTGDVKMRIFTPGSELPIAGHPTIGTTFALALEGTIARGRDRFVFELGVGPTPVSLEWHTSGLAFAWMTQPLPEFGGTISNRAVLARAMGVDVSALAERLPAQRVSCGVPYLLVPMTTRASVDSVSFDPRALAECYAEAGLDDIPVFFFTTEVAGGSDATAYSRMMAPTFGIAEDPATGSASGPLGCYLLRHGVVSPEQARALISHQGVKMGRPSRIHISIDGEPQSIRRVRVGGEAVLVGRGALTL